MAEPLLDLLERLDRSMRAPGHLAADPVSLVRAWGGPLDREVAAWIVAPLSFGRVDLFRPVLERLHGLAADGGGPHRWLRDTPPAALAEAVADLRYRWVRGRDLALLLGGLGLLLRRHGGIGAVFRRHHAPTGAWLDAALGELRAAMVEVAAALPGGPVAGWQDLPRGARHLVPVPSSGSACKRSCMALRWLVRGPDARDLGLWRWADPSALVVPLDTHVHRLARLLGWTGRVQATWRTALEVTDALRRLDPADPLRFDFALAHLGISGACPGHRGTSACVDCPLDPACRAPGTAAAGQGSAQGGSPRRARHARARRLEPARRR